MPKINPRAQVLSLSGFARASNPAHREFHRVILERLTAEFATRYGLGQLRDEYVAMMAREQAAAERFKGRNLSQTKAVAQLYNDLRAQYVGVIRLLKVYARMPMPAQAQAAQRMLHHVDVNIDKIRLRYRDRKSVV